MFLRAGFNGRHVDTGVRGLSRFVWARLVRFVPSGDLAWHGPRFLTWGSTCNFHCLVSDGLKWPDRYMLPKSDLPA
jgi:hypothetical protein